MANPHFYPAIEPYSTGTLTVDAPHELYWEQCGKPDGMPVLFIHGGPGAGCSAFDRRFFDPERYRVILLDQRPDASPQNVVDVEPNRSPVSGADAQTADGVGRVGAEEPEALSRRGFRCDRHADLRRRGLFVRRSEFFDKALSVRKIFLDKTGTLTLGTLVVSDPKTPTPIGLSVTSLSMISASSTAPD